MKNSISTWADHFESEVHLQPPSVYLFLTTCNSTTSYWFTVNNNDTAGDKKCKGQANIDNVKVYVTV